MLSHPIYSLLPVWFRKLRPTFIGGLALVLQTLAPAQIATSEYLFTHLAGKIEENPDGIGTAAHFNYPGGAAIDSSGNIYLADTFHHSIRKISPAGVVTTLAGRSDNSGSADGAGSEARFNYPTGVAVDKAGFVYVVDMYNSTVRKLSPSGVVSTLAGSPGSWLHRDGTGSAARFDRPNSLAVDSAGYVYVADGWAIRKISPAGVVTTFAGSNDFGSGSADGTGSAARFSDPSGLAIDSAGTVYVADAGNSSIRRISPTGIVTTLAGSHDSWGSADGTGSAAQFHLPNAVTVDSAGYVYVTDGDNHAIRKISPAGEVTTLAGSPGATGSADGTGSAARFNLPWFINQPAGLVVDGAGNLFVSDFGNNSIRKITPAGAVTTFAGSPSQENHRPGNADGPGATARFFSPLDIAVDRTDTLYVADGGNNTVRKISPTGVVTTLAGSPDSSGSTDGTGSVARFNYPASVALDRTGKVFVADGENHTIRKISATGEVTTLAGSPGSSGRADGTGTAARFFRPRGVAVDSNGNVFVADTVNSTIRKISPTGVVTTFAGIPLLPGGGSSADGTGSAARFNYPMKLAVDSADSIYVTDSRNHTIRKISPAGEVTTFAGSPGERGSADGTGSTARFRSPVGLTIDKIGNLFVTEDGSHTLRKISPTGVVTTLASRPGQYDAGSADGLGSAAQFSYPWGVTVDNAGNLYVADTGNNAIRKGVLTGPPVIATQPLSQTVASGSNVQFSVTAAAAPTPTYQWFFNGSAFSGATAATLSFNNARSSDAGDYTVVVTNELGSVTSTKATLTISSASAPTPPTTPAPASGGGGSIEGWFVLAFIMLGTVRCLAARAIRP